MDKKFQNGIEYALEFLKNNILKDYINNVILFGSCARKENKFNSDIDLLIVFSEDIKNVNRYNKEIRLIKSDLSYINDELPEIDIKAFIGKEWENDNSLFCTLIRKDGIELWH